MPKEKKVTGARVEYWKNKKGELNYRIIGKNGRVLAGIVQGFKRKAGIEKNLASLLEVLAFLKTDKIVNVTK